VGLKVLVYIEELFKSPGIDSLSETAFLDSFLGSDVLTGKLIFFKDLEEMLGGNVLFQMEITRALSGSSKVIFKGLYPRASKGGIPIVALSIGRYNWLKDGESAFFWLSIV